MFKLVGFLILFLQIACVQQQGGFSKPLVFGNEARGVPGEKIFFAEEANILQFLQNFENLTPTNAESGEMDSYIARCGFLDVPGEFRDFGIADQTGIFISKGQNYETYQTLFFSGNHEGNLANKKMVLDLNNLKFMGAFTYDYGAVSDSLTFAPPGTRVAVSVPTEVVGLAGTSNVIFHLLKVNGNFSNGGFVWIGDGIQSCDQVVVAPEVPEPPSSMSLKAPIKAVDVVTDPILVIGGININDTVKVYSDSRCVYEVASVLSNSNEVDVQLPSISSGTYTYYSRIIKDDGGVSPCSDISVTYTLDLIPPSLPSSIVMVDPPINTGNNETPTVRVVGVSVDDVVRVFLDSACTNQVGQSIATGSFVDITVSQLDPGAYTFFANSTDPLFNISNCSQVNASYFLDQTPPSTPSISAVSVSGGVASLTVDNLNSGDTVRIYSGSGCTGNLWATATATGASTIINTITLSAGSYNAYARSTDLAGNVSECSTASPLIFISN